jgi:hypothetical protein
MRGFRKTIVSLIAILLVAGCGNSKGESQSTIDAKVMNAVAEQVVDVVAATLAAVDTTTPVATYTAYPTYTPFPTYTPNPTYTPYPTNTSEPISTSTSTLTATPTEAPIDARVPIPSVTSAQDVLDLIAAAGLEIQSIEWLTLDSSDLEGTVEQVKFYTPSLCDGCSSMVIGFDSEAAAQTGEITFQVLVPGQFHVYRCGRLLLRMGGLKAKPQADLYANVAGFGQ